MAEVTIVYKELEEAEAKAGDVAKYCVNYGDDLQSKVINKIGSVSPSPLPAGNTRLNSANLYVKNKKGKLNTKNSNYKNFASKCASLSTNAKNADKRVGVEVNTSRENFLKEHPGLKGDGWNAFIATIVADVPILGWLVDRVNDAKDLGRDVKNTIRKWYEIEGGKKVVDTVLAVVGVVAAVVGAVVAVVGVAAAATVGAIVVAVVGVIGAAIAVWNAVANLATQIKADTCADPAFANFYGKLNDLPKILKTTTFRGKGWRKLNDASMWVATGIEITTTVCTVVSIVSSLGSILKSSGVRDMCGKTVRGKNLAGEEVDIFKYDFKDIKKTFGTKQGWKNVGTSIKNNWKKMLIGDDGFDGTAKAFRDAKAVQKIEKVDDAKKVVGAIDKGTKLVKTGLSIGERRLKSYLYDEYDVVGEVNTVIEITGVKGATKTTSSIYGEIKKAVGFDDKIDISKTRYKATTDGGSHSR